MALTGTRKAALLLMTLDSASAAELLKSASPDTVTEIAAELAVIQQSSPASRESAAGPVREFFKLVSTKKPKEVRNDYVTELLENALGKGKSQEVLSRIDEVLQNRDPFKPIREAELDDIAQTLIGESPQIASLVMAELPSVKATKLLAILPDDVRAAAVCGMTGGTEVSLEARQRVAAIIRERLAKMHQKVATPGPAAAVAAAAAPVAQTATAVAAAAQKRQAQLRRVALVVRGLDMKLRDAMIKSLSDQDSQTGTAIRKLMVMWEDVPLIGDRIMQNVLRTVDSRKLALALVNTESAVIAKVRANMSERAVAMLDEETSLLNKPKPEDIQAARETILDILREINGKGELTLDGAA